MRRPSFHLFVLALAFGCTASLRAEVKLPGVFSDHMVLQREQKLPVWGTAAPGEEVKVTLGDSAQATKADETGAWRVDLPPQQLGPARKLIVSGTNTIEIQDVLIGDVWIGSGQSNMAGGVNGYAKNDETLAAWCEETYPNLRLCRGNGGRWQEATPQNIKGFSALLFSFGRQLQADLDVPVGLIVGAVGGTPSGRWLSPEMLEASEPCQALIAEHSGKQQFEKQLAAYETAHAAWQKEAEAAKAAGKQPPREPAKPVRVGQIRGGRVGDLYEANIQPVVPYAIRGVLWDQGESGTALEGLDQFNVMGALIGGWRQAWGQGDFPFLYVQKPSGGGCAWDPKDSITARAEAFTSLPAKPAQGNEGGYRELHSRIMRHPNTAMVTARDLGSGVHPTNKSGYGRRAARVALGFAYEKGTEIYGPLYDSHKVEGKQIRVKFAHVGQGLASKHGEGLQGFQIAGNDGVFHWADAKIEGDSVIVSSGEVPEPAAVRYAWSQNAPWANLFNQDGLPALPFRTDGE